MSDRLLAALIVLGGAAALALVCWDGFDRARPRAVISAFTVGPGGLSLVDESDFSFPVTRVKAGSEIAFIRFRGDTLFWAGEGYRMRGGLVELRHLGKSHWCSIECDGLEPIPGAAGSVMDPEPELSRYRGLAAAAR